MRNIFFKTLCEEAEENDSIWLLTGDLGYSVIENFCLKFPDRFINAGVAEQNMTGIAAGLALTGKIVFTYSIVNFSSLRCLEQIRNDVCYHNLNVKIVAYGGGFTYGSQGYTHHGIEDLAILRSLPNMQILSPANALETQLITRKIIHENGPCYLRLGKDIMPFSVAGGHEPDITKPIELKKGNDLLFIVTGNIVNEALKASKLAASQNKSVAVWSMPCIKPIDRDAIIHAAKKYKIIVTVEEAQINGGLGSTVAEIISENISTKAVLVRLGVPDTILYHAHSQSSARKAFGIDSQSLYNKILELLH